MKLIRAAKKKHVLLCKKKLNLMYLFKICVSYHNM
jgi:hypothetical protein